MFLPEESHGLISTELQECLRSPVTSRFIMPLSGLLEGSFFTSFIKSGKLSAHETLLRSTSLPGNVLMLSEGRVGLDNTYSLCDGETQRRAVLSRPDSPPPIGILKLLLDKERYERAGLVGKPTGSSGAKRAKAEWCQCCRVVALFA